MKNLLGNTSVPSYVKLMSAAILAVTYLATLIYAGIFAASHGWGLDGLPGPVMLIIGTGLLYALQTLGIHTGASVAESVPHQIATPPPAATVVEADPPSQAAKVIESGQSVG